MSQLVFSICHLGSNASDGMDLLVGEPGQAGKGKEASFFQVFLYRLPAEDMAQIKGGSFHLKRSGLKEGLSTSNETRKKNPLQVYPATWVLVNPRCPQVDNQEQPSQVHPFSTLSCLISK